MAPKQNRRSFWSKIAALLTGLSGLISTVLSSVKDLRELLPPISQYSSPLALFLVGAALLLLCLILILFLRFGKEQRPVHMVIQAFLQRHNPLPQVLSTAVLFCAIVVAGGIAVHVVGVVSKVDRLSRAHATEYVGNFPANMTAINELLNDVTSTLVVAADVPAYGSFSNPTAYEEYKQNLRKLLTTNRTVTYLIYDEATAERVTRAQFNVEWATFSASEKFSNWRKFHRKDPIPQNLDEFLNILKRINDELKSELLQLGATVKTVSSDLPVFLWVADDERAIFSFYNLKGREVTEVSFQTNDANLIQVLNELQKSYRA